MKSSIFSRRKFLGLSAAAAGASFGAKSLLLTPEPLLAAENMAGGDPVRFGMIGIGMQGSGLVGQCDEPAGVVCVAAGDHYDGGHTLVSELLIQPALPVTGRQHVLLADK